MYVVLNKAEKHVPYGKLFGTTKCLTLWMRCRKPKVIRSEFNCICSKDDDLNKLEIPFY